MYIHIPSGEIPEACAPPEHRERGRSNCFFPDQKRLRSGGGEGRMCAKADSSTLGLGMAGRHVESGCHGVGGRRERAHSGKPGTRF